MPSPLVPSTFLQCYNLVGWDSLPLPMGKIGKGVCQGCILLPCCSSVHFSCSVMSDSLQPHRLQHARLACPSPTPGACSNSCPSNRWWHLTISSFIIPFSSRLQSFPTLGSFQMYQFFASGGQSIGVSTLASFLPMNILDCFL